MTFYSGLCTLTFAEDLLCGVSCPEQRYIFGTCLGTDLLVLSVLCSQCQGAETYSRNQIRVVLCFGEQIANCVLCPVHACLRVSITENVFLITDVFGMCKDVTERVVLPIRRKAFHFVDHTLLIEDVRLHTFPAELSLCALRARLQSCVCVYLCICVAVNVFTCHIYSAMLVTERTSFTWL